MRNGVVWGILELEPTEFADGMDLRCEQNRRVKNDTSIWSEQLEGWDFHY